MRTKQLVLCIAHIDGVPNHTRLEKRIVYKEWSDGEYIISMGNKKLVHRTSVFQVPYYEVNARTIRSL